MNRVGSIFTRVTIMENGAKKMGTASVLQTIKSSPGLEAAYQLHWSVKVTNARTGASRTFKK